MWIVSSAIPPFKTLKITALPSLTSCRTKGIMFLDQKHKYLEPLSSTLVSILLSHTEKSPLITSQLFPIYPPPPQRRTYSPSRVLPVFSTFGFPVMAYWPNLYTKQQKEILESHIDPYKPTSAPFEALKKAIINAAALSLPISAKLFFSVLLRNGA